ncbi:MAG: hypothetical protein AB1486_30325 [Planctomycetota bacterium]
MVDKSETVSPHLDVSPGSSAVAGEPRWFSVPEAAKILEVDEDAIFSGIRAGEIRVRFETIAGSDRERPLVTSDRLMARQPDGGLPESGFTSLAANGETPQEGERRASAPAVAPRGGPPREPSDDHDSLRRRIEQLQGENAELQGAVQELEAKTEQSLRAIYERDVQLARLEAALDAANRVEGGVQRFAERLEKRIERLETTAEDKEREIRRLALTLGEARGEIKLLRAPDPPAGRIPWLLLARLFVVGLFAGAGGWGVHGMAQKQQSLEAAVIAAAGVVIASALVLLIPARPRARGR